jgi:hypothetical protein
LPERPLARATPLVPHFILTSEHRRTQAKLQYVQLTRLSSCFFVDLLLARSAAREVVTRE